MAEPSASQHQQVCELIPWYINGTLGEQDMDQVSAHVTECAECAQEVLREVEIAKQMRRDPPALEALIDVQPKALEALKQQLHRPARLRRAAHYSGPLYWARWPALAAGFMLAIALGFLVGRSTSESTYTLMTTTPAEHNPVVQVIFQPNAREQDIRLLLSDSGGALLGSPSAKGVYRIVLEGSLPNGMDAAAYAARLAQHPSVRWAEVELR